MAGHTTLGARWGAQSLVQAFGCLRQNGMRPLQEPSQTPCCAMMQRVSPHPNCCAPFPPLLPAAFPATTAPCRALACSGRCRDAAGKAGRQGQHRHRSRAGAWQGAPSRHVQCCGHPPGAAGGSARGGRCPRCHLAACQHCPVCVQGSAGRIARVRGLTSRTELTRNACMLDWYGDHNVCFSKNKHYRRGSVFSIGCKTGRAQKVTGTGGTMCACAANMAWFPSIWLRWNHGSRGFHVRQGWSSSRQQGEGHSTAKVRMAGKIMQ